MLTVIASIVAVAVALLPAVAELVRISEDRQRGQHLLGRHGVRRRSIQRTSMSASASFC
jgi:hypothetical protein